MESDYCDEREVQYIVLSRGGTFRAVTRTVVFDVGSHCETDDIIIQQEAKRIPLISSAEYAVVHYCALFHDRTTDE